MKRQISSRRLGGALALLAAVGVLLAIILNTESPSKAGSANGSNASDTATVERRDLVESDTEGGTVSYADPQTVYDRVSGTITWLPSVGALIKPGGTLFMVDGQAVIMMSGTTPAYRELAPGMTDGHDVLQLNRNLVALGYDPDAIALDDEWQSATTVGVEELQGALGQARTGRLTFGRVVFLPGDQLVSNVEATLGAGGSGNASAAGTSDPASDGRIEYASFETTTSDPSGASGGPAPDTKSHRPPSRPHAHPQPTRMGALEALIERLKGEIQELRSAVTPRASAAKSPAASHASSPDGPQEGSGGAVAATPILQTTSTRPVVTVELVASKRSEARIGEPVTVELPDGESLNGTVTAVSPIAKSAGGSEVNNGGGGQAGGANAAGGSGSTIPVTISLSGRHTGASLDQAAVNVSFAQAAARNVLSVPVTALLATGGASYAVQEAAASHGVIPVTTGLFAAGFVQVSGRGIHAGLRVTDSQG